MQSVPTALAERLDKLTTDGVIAGWQDAGGPNYGNGKTPLPAMVFPRSYGPASAYHDESDLATAIGVLETFGEFERPWVGRIGPVGQTV